MVSEPMMVVAVHLEDIAKRVRRGQVVSGSVNWSTDGDHIEFDSKLTFDEVLHVMHVDINLEPEKPLPTPVPSSGVSSIP